MNASNRAVPQGTIVSQYGYVEADVVKKWKAGINFADITLLDEDLKDGGHCRKLMVLVIGEVGTGSPDSKGPLPELALQDEPLQRRQLRPGQALLGSV